jgi:hypothetical protein
VAAFNSDADLRQRSGSLVQQGCTRSFFLTSPHCHASEQGILDAADALLMANRYGEIVSKISTSQEIAQMKQFWKMWK